MHSISTSAFTLEARPHDEEGMALALHGELDIDVAMEARELAEIALREGHDLSLDLTGLEFVDSSGLVMLLGTSELASTLGRRLTIIGPLQQQVRRVLRLSGLDGLLPTR